MRYSVQYEGLRRCARELEETGRDLLRVSEALGEIRRRLSGMDQLRDVRRTLLDYSGDMERQKNCACQLAAAAERVCGICIATERKLCGLQEGGPAARPRRRGGGCGCFTPIPMLGGWGGICAAANETEKAEAEAAAACPEEDEIEIPPSPHGNNDPAAGEEEYCPPAPAPPEEADGGLAEIFFDLTPLPGRPVAVIDVTPGFALMLSAMDLTLYPYE